MVQFAHEQGLLQQKSIHAFCLGEQTASALRQSGLTPIIAQSPRFDALLETMVDWFNRSASS